MNMHSPGTAEDEATICLGRWEAAAVAFENARDRAERADSERKLLFDLAVDDLIGQAKVQGVKMAIGTAERAVSVSDRYQKAVDTAHRLKLEAGLARIAERRTHHEHEAAVRRTHSERAERRMYGR